MRRLATAPQAPSISVVVNSCDRCPSLRRLLHSLRRQSYPAFEVVVVLGPTHDDSRAVLAEELAGRVVVVDCPQFNLSVSRNLGVMHAAGDVVAFIDDDAVPSATWLEQLAAAYIDHPEVAGVGGRTYLVTPGAAQVQFLCGTVSVLAEQDDVRWHEDDKAASATPDRFWFPRFHGTNMSYRRHVLLAAGGFDERFEYLFDDADIAVRLGLAGHRLLHLRQAAVYHDPASGPNRGERSPFDLNWYCWLRSTIYFALHNGRRTVGLRHSLARALAHTSRFYTVVAELVATGKLTLELHRKARRMLRRGWWEGFATGLAGRRRIADRLEPARRAFHPFPRPEDRTVAAIPTYGLRRSDAVKLLDQEPLRIGLLSVGYPPRSTEGVARSTQILARGLAELGHEVHVVTAGETRRTLFRDGAYVHEIRPTPQPKYTFLADRHPTLGHWLDYSHSVYAEVEALRVNHRIQLVDAALWNLDGLVTAVAAELPVVVRVVTAMKQIAGFFHQPASAEHRLLGELEGKLLELAAAVISNTRATERTVAEVYGYDPAAAQRHAIHRVVHYGIVPVAEEALAPDRDTEEAPQVLFVGRLESRKGILDLFEAIPAVLRQRPGVRFVIAGRDNSGEDGFQARHRMDYPTYFARTYPGCRSQVDFRGFVDDETLHRLYRGCDFLVAPSLYESFGLIYLEAMNYARPVIGCNAGGPQDIVVDGETGFLVPPGDAASLAEAILKLLAAGPRGRREMGRAGRELLLRRFTHRAMAEGFADVYRSVLIAST